MTRGNEGFVRPCKNPYIILIDLHPDDNIEGKGSDDDRGPDSAS